MPTVTHGLFFVGRDSSSGPATSTAIDPTAGFVLTLRVVDNQGPRAVELYVVRWSGVEAETWWAKHGPLKAGDALSLELLNPRTFQGLRWPETHATVRACQLMPPRVPTAMTAPRATT